MKEIIRRGTSPEKVIAKFKKENNLSDSELEYVIEYKGSKGFLSLFGKKEAVVKFVVPTVEEKLIRYLATLLKHLDIKYKDIQINTEKNTYHTHIKGVDNPGFLIGKDGKMLASIEILLNKIVDDKEHRSDNVVLDIDNYKARSNSSSSEKPSQRQSPKAKQQHVNKDRRKKVQNTPPKRARRTKKT